MVTASIRRIVRKFRSGKILNRIGSGKICYFENPMEEIAFRYVPGEPGKLGKYYAKYYGRKEYEISFDSTSILMGVMEGKQISRAKYDSFHLIESVIRNRKIDIPALNKAVSNAWVYV